VISFFVRGIPQPKGSTKAFYIARLKRAIVTSDNKKLKPWEGEVRAAAEQAQGNSVPGLGPFDIEIVFYVPRPGGHWGKKGLLPSAPAFPTKKPDLDKLGRGLLDGLTGCVFVDDAQVVDLHIRKRFAGEAGPGAEITIRPLTTRVEEPAPARQLQLTAV
jgi:Holliday junction resolvase RusA-like endonuclease